MNAETVVAALGWVVSHGNVYVNVDDLVAMLRRAGYEPLASELAAIAEEERERSRDSIPPPAAETAD